MIQIAIVDDNPLVRNSFEKRIRLAGGFEVSGNYATVSEALVLIPMTQPDIVLMDIHLDDDVTGIECIRRLKPAFPAMEFIVCTVYEDDENIFEAICAGASGYLLKKTDPAELLWAIGEVCGGGAPMSGSIARKILQVFQLHESGTGWNPLHAKKGKPLSALSKRENEILQLLATGCLYKEIAANLFISGETVRKHVSHIYEKLQVGNRVEAINKYFRRT